MVCKQQRTADQPVHTQGLHRLEKYLNIQDCLKKFLKNRFARKSI